MPGVGGKAFAFPPCHARDHTNLVQTSLPFIPGLGHVTHRLVSTLKFTQMVQTITLYRIPYSYRKLPTKVKSAHSGPKGILAS